MTPSSICIEAEVDWLLTFLFHYLSELPPVVSDVGEVDVDLFVERMVEVCDELKEKTSANITNKAKEYMTADILQRYMTCFPAM